MIISAIAVPVLANTTGLTYQAEWEASDLQHNLYAWSTLSYSGGNGSRVYCYAIAITNLQNQSVIDTYSTAVSASFIGPNAAYALSTPFVTYNSGTVYYAPIVN